jgi:hypothetical protein
MRMLRSWLGLAVPMLALVTAVPIAAERSAHQAQSAAAPQTPATTEKLPSAREVLDRHIKAVGGREFLMARSSSHATGTVEMPGPGLKGTLELFQAKPNSMLMRVTLPGVGDVQEGFNGRVGWSISPMTGPSLLQGKQLEERRIDADFYGDLQPEKHYESVTVVEKTTFEGRPCYKMRLVQKGGVEDFHFFDAHTGLKAGAIVTRESPMGAVTATTVESDYKPFGKLLTPTKLTMTMMGIQQVMTILTVEYDKVDPSVFEPPAQIKALMK